MGVNLPIECPFCGEVFSQDLREVSLNGSRSCPGCRQEILFTGGFLIKVLRRIEGSRGRGGEGLRRVGK